MKEIYLLLGAICDSNKRVITFKKFPSGTYHLSIYDHNLEQTFLYDQPDGVKMYHAVYKDWSHLLVNEASSNDMTVNEWGVWPKNPSLPKKSSSTHIQTEGERKGDERYKNETILPPLPKLPAIPSPLGFPKP